MAYVDDTLLEDDQNQQEGGPALAASGAGQTTKSATQSPQDIAKRGSGNFQNLGEYLRVNAPQQFGQKVAGKIGDEINSADQTINQAQTDFQSRVDNNAVRDTDNLTGQVATDPRQVNQDQFAKLRDAQYGGPSSLYDTEDLAARVQGAAGSAVGKANASQSESGRFALLDSYFGKPKYTQGEKTLDNLLIQNDPGSQQAFQQMRQNADQLNNRSKQIAPESEQYAAQGRATTEATRNAARNALGIDNSGNLTGTGAIGSIKGQLPTRTTDKNAALAKQYQDAVALAAQNKFGLTPEFLSAMGISGDRGYGVDPSQYVSQNPSLNENQVVSQDEAGRLRALEGLANAGPLLSDYSHAGEADNAKAYSFDKNAYQGNVASQKASYENALAPISKNISDLTSQIESLQRHPPIWLDPAEVQQQVNALDAQRQQYVQQKSTLDQKYLGGA